MVNNCPKCGSVRVGAEKFCLDCGIKFLTVSSPAVSSSTQSSPGLSTPPSTAYVCSCGTANDLADGNFCIECGAKTPETKPLAGSTPVLAAKTPVTFGGAKSATLPGGLTRALTSSDLDAKSRPAIPLSRPPVIPGSVTSNNSIPPSFVRVATAEAIGSNNNNFSHHKASTSNTSSTNTTTTAAASSTRLQLHPLLRDTSKTTTTTSSPNVNNNVSATTVSAPSRQAPSRSDPKLKVTPLVYETVDFEEVGKIISLEELALHNQQSDAWVGLYGKVYNVTQWLSKHPGGLRVLLRVCGKDATEMFVKFHTEEVLQEHAKSFYVGDLDPDAVAELPTPRRPKPANLARKLSQAMLAQRAEEETKSPSVSALIAETKTPTTTSNNKIFPGSTATTSAANNKISSFSTTTATSITNNRFSSASSSNTTTTSSTPTAAIKASFASSSTTTTTTTSTNHNRPSPSSYAHKTLPASFSLASLSSTTPPLSPSNMPPKPTSPLPIAVSPTARLIGTAFSSSSSASVVTPAKTNATSITTSNIKKDEPSKFAPQTTTTTTTSTTSSAPRRSSTTSHYPSGVPLPALLPRPAPKIFVETPTVDTTQKSHSHNYASMPAKKEEVPRLVLTPKKEETPPPLAPRPAPKIVVETQVVEHIQRPPPPSSFPPEPSSSPTVNRPPPPSSFPRPTIENNNNNNDHGMHRSRESDARGPPPAAQFRPQSPTAAEQDAVSRPPPPSSLPRIEKPATPAKPQNFGRPFEKSEETIENLVAILASDEGLQYVATICDAPFRATLHPQSVDALNLLLGDGQQLEFGDIPGHLKDQLPNLLKKYTAESSYRFGRESSCDRNMAKICYAIIATGKNYRTFGAMCIAFPAVHDVEPEYNRLVRELNG